MAFGQHSSDSWSSRNRSRFSLSHPLTLLVVLVVVCVTFGVIHKRWSQNGRPDPLLNGVSVLTYPFQWGTRYLQGTLFSGWDKLVDSGKTAQENRQLQAKVAELQLKLEEYSTKAEEAERLRQNLKFIKEQKKPPIIAQVIGWYPSPFFDTITVGRGSRDGIRVGSIVRTPTGLVGRVYEVGLVSAQVLLLSDADSGVHALLYRNGKPLKYAGVVQGSGRNAPLKIVYLHREDAVKTGDEIRSSGYGGMFPKDIPIGRIGEIAEDKVRSIKSATVVPFAATPGTLNEVLILP